MCTRSCADPDHRACTYTFRHTNSSSCPLADTDTHTYPCSTPCVDSYAHTYVSAHPDAHPNAHPLTRADSYAHTYTSAYPHAHPNADSHPHPDANSPCGGRLPAGTSTITGTTSRGRRSL